MNEIFNLDLMVDVDLNLILTVHFNTRNTLPNHICPNKECGWKGLIVGVSFATNEKFTFCRNCGCGQRYLPKSDIC